MLAKTQEVDEHNIICIEDLVHEILNGAHTSRRQTTSTGHTKLKAPLGGLTKKRNHYVDDNAGNRENYINQLVKRTTGLISSLIIPNIGRTNLLHIRKRMMSS